MGLGRLILFSTVVLMMAMALPTPAVAAKKGGTFERAMEAFDREDYAKSRRLLAALLKQSPGNALYWFNFGNASIKLKLWREAMQAYEQVVKLKSPLAGVAGIYLSKAARADGRTASALHWMRWVQKKPLPAGIEQLARDESGYVQAELMEQGLSAYEVDAFQKAIVAFEKVQSLTGDPQLSAQAEMMKGLSLLKLDRTDQARTEFETLTSRGTSIQGIQQYVRYFSRLDQQTLTVDPPYWLAFDLALTYNNNLFADGDPAIAEGRAVIPWFAGGGVRVFRSGLYSITLGDNLSGEEVPGLRTSRYLKNSFFALYKLQTSAWQLQVQGALDYSALGGEPYSIRPAISVSGQYIEGPERIGLTLTSSYQHPESDVFSHIKGSIHSARAFWIHRYATGAGGPFLFISRENTGSLPLATGTIPLGHASFGAGASGYLYPVQGWEVSGSISYAVRSYTELAQPGDLERSDQVFSIYSRVARRVNRYFAPYFSVDGAVNSSSLGQGAPDDRNFGQFVVGMGVSWDLL